MSTRHMRLFALPKELLVLLGRQADRLGLVATVYPPHFRSDTIGRTVSLGEISPEWLNAPAEIMRIFMHTPDNIRHVSWRDAKPGEFDWVDVWPGRLLTDAAPYALELTSIAVKSEHASCLRLFSQLTGPLKARLHHPMRVRGLLNGVEDLSSVYYTDATERFQEEGGELVQWGVKYIRFFPSDPAPGA